MNCRKSTTMMIVGGLLCLDDDSKIRKRRRVWAKNWLQERNKFSHMPLIKEIAVNEPQDFFNYLRMSEETFKDLLQRVSHRIQKQNTIMRQSVTAEERLVATLQFLASGRSYENLKLAVQYPHNY